MMFRFTVSKLTILFSAGALAAVGCGGGPGAVPTSHSGQDSYASSGSTTGNSTIPGTISPVDPFGAIGPGPDSSPLIGSPNQGGSDTPTPVDNQGGGGSSQGSAGQNQGGSGKGQGSAGKSQGGAGSSGVDCKTLCECPAAASIKDQCLTACKNPSPACLSCAASTGGDCSKLTACAEACLSGSQGGAGSSQGGAGGSTGGAGMQQGGAGASSGATCNDLSACCETLNPQVKASYQSTCDAYLQMDNDTSCASLYSALKMYCPQ
jgi:hypothetical protein